MSKLMVPLKTRTLSMTPAAIRSRKHAAKVGRMKLRDYAKEYAKRNPNKEKYIQHNREYHERVAQAVFAAFAHTRRKQHEHATLLW